MIIVHTGSCMNVLFMLWKAIDHVWKLLIIAMNRHWSCMITYIFMSSWTLSWPLAERGRVLEVAAKGESLIRQEPSYVYQDEIHTRLAIWCLFGDWYFSYLSIIFPKRDTTILSKPYPISCSTRVVAASFYGDMQTGYYRGIVDNIRLTEVGQTIPLTLQEFYPGWIFRLYVDGGEMKNETKQQLCEVSCSSDMWDKPL